MPYCPRILGFGMSHVQSLLLAVAYSTDPMLWTAMANAETSNNNLAFSRKFNLILSGLARITSAVMISRINSKYVILVIEIAQIIFTLMTHSLLLVYGPQGMMVAYHCFQFVQSTRFPLSLNILSKWCMYSKFTFLLTLHEVTQLVLGSFLKITTQNLVDKGYSEVAVTVYMMVAVKTTFCVLWVVMGSEDPIKNTFISPEELAELKVEHHLRIPTRLKNIRPYKGILSTPILYGVLLYDCTCFWSRDWMERNSSFLEPLGLYLNGGAVMSLIGFYVKMIATLITGYLIDEMIRRGVASVTNIRKTTAAITAYGCGCCTLLLGNTIGSSYFHVWCVFFNIFCVPAFLYEGAVIIHSATPNYLGFIYGCTSAIAYFSLCFLTRVEEFLLGIGDKADAMYFTGLLTFFGCFIMLLMGSCHRRDWDTFGTVTWKTESSVSFP